MTAVVAWAGTRGVVPLAAALSIPLTDDSGAPLAGRDLVLVLAIAVIAISLVVQGFTSVRRGPAQRAGAARLRMPRPRLGGRASGWTRTHCPIWTTWSPTDAGDPALVERVRQQLRRTGSSAAAAEPRTSGRAEAYRRLWQDVVAVQSERAGPDVRGTHQLSDAAYHQVQRQLDLEHARLADD